MTTIHNASPYPHAEKSEIQQNKLLDAQNGKRMDCGTASAAGGLDKAMATVGKVDRALGRLKAKQ